MRTRTIPFIIFFLLALVPMLASPSQAAFSMGAEPEHGTQGFSVPTYDPNGEVLNNTQHDGNDITLKRITKITEVAGYYNPSINKGVAYATAGMIVYTFDPTSTDIEPQYYINAGGFVAGERIVSMVAAPDGLYMTIKLNSGKYAGYYYDYAGSFTQITEADLLPWYWYKDIDDGTAYAARLKSDHIEFRIWENGVNTFSKDISFDGYYLRLKKRGDYLAILGSNELKIYNIRTDDINVFARLGPADVKSTMFYTNVEATDYIYALIDGYYPEIDQSAVEVYDYNGNLVARYPVPKSAVLFHSQTHNAYVLGGSDGINVYYGGFTAPAEHYDYAVSEVAADDETPVFAWGTTLYVFTFRNYTASGTYTSPAVDTDGRIITGVFFHPVYEQPNGTNISFYVSNDAGATWLAVNVSSGNVSFPGASEGDSVFMWKAEMSGDTYQTPRIKSVSWVLHTEDPVEITEFSLDGWLKTNRTAYYPGDAVDVIVDIKDRDNEGEQWTWEWNFHDPYANASNPNTANTPWNATHIYTRPGTYYITLNVSDKDGHSDSMNTTVIIADRQPEAKIWATTPYGSNDQFVSVHPLDNVMLDARNSTDPDMPYNPDEDIVAYRWPTLGLTGSVINTSFNSDGVYNVILEVEDAYGLTHTTSITVYVASGNLPPQPHIVAPETAMINTDVQFSSAGTVDPDGDTLTYFWQFGDGANSTAPNPTHTYTEYGTYVVNLTVSDGNYNVSYYHVITILPYPESGDWVVTSHIKVEDWTITMRGNIYIEAGGWLELINSTIYMDVPADGYYEVYVKEGGKLTMDGSNLLTPYTKYGEDLYYRYHFYTFRVDGQAYINDSTVRNTHMDKISNIDGITVGNTGHLAVLDSNLIWSKGHAVSRNAITPIDTAPAVSITDSVIAMNYGGVYFNNAYNLSVSGTLFKNMQEGVDTSGSYVISVSGSTFKRILSRAITIYDTAIARVENNSMDSVFVGLFVSATDVSIKNNEVEGSGNGSIAYDIYQSVNLYDCIGRYSGIGLSAHTSLNVYDCTFKLNTYDYYVSGTVHVWYSVMFEVRYLNNPVDSGYVLVKNGDTVIANQTVKNGHTDWAYYEMERIGTTSRTVFNLTAEAHYKDMLMQAVIPHEAHTVITFNFSPIPENGGVAIEEAKADYFHMAIWLVLFWAVILFAWFKRILRLTKTALMTILTIGTAGIAAYHGAINPYIAGAIAIGITGLIMAIKLSGKGRIVALLATIGGVMALLYQAGYIGIGVGFDNNMAVMVSEMAILLIVGYLYMVRGIGRGKEYIVIPGMALLMALVYGVITGNMLYFYVGIVLGLMAVVVWFVLVSGSNISFGAAALVLAMVGIVALVIAFMLGVWYPGMYVEQITSEMAKQANPFSGWEWPSFGW